MRILNQLRASNLAVRERLDYGSHRVLTRQLGYVFQIKVWIKNQGVMGKIGVHHKSSLTMCIPWEFGSQQGDLGVQAQIAC